RSGVSVFYLKIGEYTHVLFNWFEGTKDERKFVEFPTARRRPARHVRAHGHEKEAQSARGSGCGFGGSQCWSHGIEQRQRKRCAHATQKGAARYGSAGGKCA